MQGVCVFLFKYQDMHSTSKVRTFLLVLTTEALYLLQYGVDPAHFTVDEEAFLLPPIHLLDDASVLYGVHDVPHRASRHLPVVGYG